VTVDLDTAVSALGRGEIVAFPTESSYGLGVDARQPEAVERLFLLKGRDETKPPPILIGDEAMLESLVEEVPARARVLMERYWPGPLTLVLPARRDLSPRLVSPAGVGVRRSPHLIANRLVAAFGGPITASSANRAGEPPALSGPEVEAIFGSSFPVLDGSPAPGAAPSTVVEVSRAGELVVIRAGALDPVLLMK
jgi:L-threonylcarbamoyladenylate synthase